MGKVGAAGMRMKASGINGSSSSILGYPQIPPLSTAVLGPVAPSWYSPCLYRMVSRVPIGAHSAHPGGGGRKEHRAAPWWEEWEGTARPQNEAERETQLAVDVPAALSRIRGLGWGQWPPTWLRGCCLFPPGARCTPELTLTLGGQGARTIHWAAASE